MSSIVDIAQLDTVVLHTVVTWVSVRARNQVERQAYIVGTPRKSNTVFASACVLVHVVAASWLGDVERLPIGLIDLEVDSMASLADRLYATLLFARDDVSARRSDLIVVDLAGLAFHHDEPDCFVPGRLVCRGYPAR